MEVSILILWTAMILLHWLMRVDSTFGSTMKFKRNPAPDSHRCGLCPTYFQKICAFNFQTNSTFIFDNHCIMDLYNCIEGTEFVPMNYDNCLYFGNFAYVHGFKYEDLDYGEDHIIIKNTKKNPDYVRHRRNNDYNMYE